jgi:hypothetical protein
VSTVHLSTPTIVINKAHGFVHNGDFPIGCPSGYTPMLGNNAEACLPNGKDGSDVSGSPVQVRHMDGASVHVSHLNGWGNHGNPDDSGMSRQFDLQTGFNHFGFDGFNHSGGEFNHFGGGFHRF